MPCIIPRSNEESLPAHETQRDALKAVEVVSATSASVSGSVSEPDAFWEVVVMVWEAGTLWEAEAVGARQEAIGGRRGERVINRGRGRDVVGAWHT